MIAGEIIEEMLRNPLTDGLSLSGGEPVLQADECSVIAAAARENKLNVWLFSGYTFEELAELSESVPAIGRLLGLVDVLVDGRYEDKERTLLLKWRGSRNQRVLDMRKSLEAGAAVECEV